jgi:hypothetical protein
MHEPLRMLLSGLIDYAGLFPPAKLDMSKSAENYARARIGEHAWMLGRFICPASRLREFSKAAAVLMPGTHGTSGYREHADTSEPWRISVLVDSPIPEALELVQGFNQHHDHEDNGLAQADVLELKADRPSDIDTAIEQIPDHLYPFFEFPALIVNRGDARGFIAALAGNAAAAKIRTGGITPEAIPSPEAVASFLVACAAAEVPFKATAGLHHPIRAEYPLTYEESCPRGVMHGFLNVFLAAAMLKIHRLDLESVTSMLREEDAGEFKFTPEGVRWGDYILDSAQISLAREAFALSYGSCSFDEPIDDLDRLGLL